MVGFHPKLASELDKEDATFAKAGDRWGRAAADAFKARFDFAKMPSPNIRPQVDDRLASLELDHLARDRRATVKVDVETSALSKIKSLTGGLGGAGGSAASGLPALGSLGPYAIGAGVAVGASLLPAALPTAIGGGFAALGVLAAAKFSTSLQKNLKGTENTFTSVLQDATGPLGRFFSGQLPGINQFIKAMGPGLTQAFTASEPFLKTFLGVGEQFASTMLPVFTKLETQFAPDLPGIAKGFGALTTGISKFFGAFTGHGMQAATTDFIGLMTALGLGLEGAGKAANFLAVAFADVGHWVNTEGPEIASGFLQIESVGLTVSQSLTDVFLGTLKNITHGAADAFGWVPGIGGKLKSADASLGQFKASVDASFGAAQTKIGDWKTTLANAPKVAALKGNITDLTSKLNTAKHELKDPTLTAVKRASVQANISQLQKQLAAARTDLAKLQGKTITINVQAIGNGLSLITGPAGTSIRRTAGGLQGFASGTQDAPPGWAWVGESGPELMRLRGGEAILSNMASLRAMHTLPALPALPGVTAPAPAGGMTLRAVYDGPPNGAVQAIMSQMRFEIQHSSGGDVQAALGRGKVR